MQENRLVESLVEKGLLKRDIVDFVARIAKVTGASLSDVIVGQGLVSEEDVYREIASISGTGFLPELEDNLIEMNPRKPYTIEDVKIMRTYRVLPLTGRRLAVCSPESARKVFVKFGMRTPVVVPPTVLFSSILKMLLRMYEGTLDDFADEEKMISNASFLVDVIIAQAITERATDIHFEASDPCYVRFRIDGELVPQFSYGRNLHRYIANIILMRSLGNPSDEQRFDDASFEYELSPTMRVPIRVSKAPTSEGPGIVLRIIRRDYFFARTLSDLGFLEGQVEVLRRIISRPHGALFVCGPTGSGKTTTLYALVNEIKDFSIKIMSIEDPIEIVMPLVEQVQVNPQAGITFDSALKYFLRRDPDVIIIGEIRDPETAKIAMDAAMTGHLVLSTIHANTVFDVLTRLHDFGVSYRKMSSLLGIVNQRLVRMICRRCSGRGCERCLNTGRYGRTAVAEILECTPELRRALYDEDPSAFARIAVEEGFKQITAIVHDYVERGLVAPEDAEAVGI